MTDRTAGLSNLMTLSMAEVSKRTGFSRARIHRLCANGRLAYLREGRGARRILETSLIAYFEGMTVATSAPSASRTREARRRAADQAARPRSGDPNPFD
jgi:hypothetical protein